MDLEGEFLETSLSGRYAAGGEEFKMELELEHRRKSLQIYDSQRVWFLAVAETTPLGPAPRL